MDLFTNPEFPFVILRKGDEYRFINAVDVGNESLSQLWRVALPAEALQAAVQHYEAIMKFKAERRN